MTRSWLVRLDKALYGYSSIDLPLYFPSTFLLRLSKSIPNIDILPIFAYIQILLILRQPQTLVDILGRTIPSVSLYFVNLVIVKIFTAVPLEVGVCVCVWRCGVL